MDVVGTVYPDAGTMGERFSLIESSTPRSTTGADSTLAIFRIRP
jgi:hypothetical protein